MIDKLLFALAVFAGSVVIDRETPIQPPVTEFSCGPVTCWIIRDERPRPSCMERPGVRCS